MREHCERSLPAPVVNTTRRIPSRHLPTRKWGTINDTHNTLDEATHMLHGTLYAGTNWVSWSQSLSLIKRLRRINDSSPQRGENNSLVVFPILIAHYTISSVNVVFFTQNKLNPLFTHTDRRGPTIQCAVKLVCHFIKCAARDIYISSHCNRCASCFHYVSGLSTEVREIWAAF